jgi:hypothetical protein
MTFQERNRITIDKILAKIPQLLRVSSFTTLFRWEKYLCEQLYALGYLTRLKGGSYYASSKGKELVFKMEDPMEYIVICGKMRPLIVEALMQVERERSATSGGGDEKFY